MYKKYILLREEKGVTDYKAAQETGITKSTFTDYKVAVETGIPASTFTDWKNGRSNPKLDKLKKIADYFGVTVDYFIENQAELQKTADNTA